LRESVLATAADTVSNSDMQAGQSGLHAGDKPLPRVGVVFLDFSNIIRHASAEQVRVQVEFLPTQWNILIEDNGLGFQRHAVQGNGLHNIETRATEIGAEVHWQGELQRGTRCLVSLPFHLLRPTSPLL
jgi:signal transduction histidine kinase